MPPWALGIIVALAAIEPLLHLWIPHDAPAGTRWSGLHTVDTYAYLTAMEHAQAGYSPYARCTSPVGDTDPSLYALPHHVMYGWIGVVGRVLHVPPFFWLGLVNGLSAAFLLWAAWRLLREAVPDLARLAFLFFALGGGVGGVAYLVARLIGLTDDPGFAANFDRFATYEIIEGARFQPWLLLSRIYYSFPLGLGFLALTVLLRHLRHARKGDALLVLGLFFTCAFMNFRLGPMIWVVAVLYLLCAAQVPARQRWITGLLITPATFTGVALAVRWLSANPELSESALRALSGQMWLLPFVSATALYWIVLPASIRRGVSALPPLARVLGHTGMLFAGVYTVLYLGYQAYYGNWLRGGDTSAAIAASDPALIVAFTAGLLMLSRISIAHPPLKEVPGRRGKVSAVSWFALWFLAFFCMSIAAFGDGWFLQFTPQRFMVVLALPMAVLAADGVRRVGVMLPRRARFIAAGIVTCGVISILVTWFGSYGPWGYHGLQQHYPQTRWAYVTAADAALIEAIEVPDTVVLAPALTHPILGDVAVQHGHRAVYGNGTLDFSREVMPFVRGSAHRFFNDLLMTEDERTTLLKDWCVDYILCPEGEPVSEAAMSRIDAIPGVERIAEVGRGALYRVTR